MRKHGCKPDEKALEGTGGVDATGALGTALAFLIFVEVTSGFVQGFYSPLLPSFAKYLGVSGEAMNWFQTSQAIAAAVTVPLLSRLGDIFGARRILRIAVLLVLLGTLMTALVPSYPIVLLGRAFVGPLGVWLPLAIAIVYARVSGQSATRTISILSASLLGGIVLGTAAAGLIGQFTHNMMVTLLLPVLLVAISAYAVFFKIPESATHAKTAIDWAGFFGLALVMVSFIMALAYLGPSHAALSATLFGVTAALAAVWVWWEKRSKSPAIDLELVVSKELGPLYLAGFLLGIVIIDAPPNLSDFLSRDPEIYGYGFAASTELLSAMIATMLLAATVGAFSSSFIAARFGMRRSLVTAALIAAFGQVLLLLFSGAIGVFWVSGILTGGGLGVFVGALPALVAHAAPRDRTGIATGVYNALLAMGGAVGGAVFRLSLTAFRDDSGITHLGGFMVIWGICTGVFVISALLMMFVRLGRRAEESESVVS